MGAARSRARSLHARRSPEGPDQPFLRRHPGRGPPHRLGPRRPEHAQGHRGRENRGQHRLDRRDHSNDRRQHDPHRASRLSDDVLQGADDLQPLFREHRVQRRRRADGREGRGLSPRCLRTLFRLTNIRGALVTMPHKVTTVGLVDEVVHGGADRGRVQRHPAAAGRHACWATCSTARASCAACCARAAIAARRTALVVGSGGVGCAIAASLAAAGVAALGLFDVHARVRRGAGRAAARRTIPASSWPSGRTIRPATTIVVNATPLGMNAGDPLPVDVARIEPVGLRRRGRDEAGDHAVPRGRARAGLHGCRSGTDMLFEQIPAYLEFFGFPSTTARQRCAQ